MSWLKFLTEVIPKVQPSARSVKLHENLSLSRDLGLASMQLLELVEAIERKAGKRLPVEEIFVSSGGGAGPTLGGLAAWVEGQAPFGAKKK
jgi:acyl carrier protein